VTDARVLIAGLGNIFAGDDGFGVEVARRLALGELPASVRVVDFGIRSFDLACALVDGYEAAILVDLTPRGGAPGTLYVIDPELGTGEALRNTDGHGLPPTKVFALARALGGTLPRMRIIGCEPLELGESGDDDVTVGLSEPVLAAVIPAMDLALSLAAEITRPADA
jgi:hydrogenase maturation protease